MKEKKNLRAHNEEKLPWDLMEEILSHVPPKSLVRFRAVSKPWNNLFNNKRFLSNHKTTFHFVITTKSKFYTVNVSNPKKIDIRELNFDIPGLGEFHKTPRKLIDFSEFLICPFNKGATVWNPWLRQSTTLIKPGSKHYLMIEGIGYDNNRNYKIIGHCSLWRIYDFVSESWKDYDYDHYTNQRGYFLQDNGVSLNGTLYWVAGSSIKKNEEYRLCIFSFDFSKEQFLFFCDLPCRKNHKRDAFVLGVFKEDQFSLLKQCNATKKIEIFVTKDKITSNCDVVWMNFMQVSIPNFPDLVQNPGVYSYSQPSYFIDNDKRLIVCSCDETGKAWIYVVWENKLISQTRMDSVVDLWPLHCTYSPSLVMVPSIQREEV